MPSKENTTNKESLLSKPKSGKVEDMLDISLTNDEMCQLMDDMSWSPLLIKLKRQQDLVSPAKQYVRSKSSEMKNLAGAVVVQNKANHQDAGMLIVS